MSNPIFGSSDIFGDPATRKSKGRTAQAERGGQVLDPQAAVLANAQFEQVQEGYYGPSATPIETGRLAYDDVIVKTAIMFAVIVAVGAVTWTLNPAIMMPVVMVGLVGGLVLGLVNSFKKEPSPVLIIGYSVFEGMLLGGISKLMESMYPGVVIQAVLATFLTFGVTLALFTSGKVRASSKMAKFTMIALISYLLLMVTNMVLTATGVIGGSLLEITIMGIPLGVVVGIVAVLIGAFMLIMDFDSIKRGVEAGAPSKYAWTAAFGLVVTLVWIYIQFLRLFSYFARD